MEEERVDKTDVGITYCLQSSAIICYVPTKRIAFRHNDNIFYFLQILIYAFIKFLTNVK